MHKIVCVEIESDNIKLCLLHEKRAGKEKAEFVFAVDSHSPNIHASEKTLIDLQKAIGEMLIENRELKMKKLIAGE